MRKTVFIALGLLLTGALAWLAVDQFQAPPTVEWVIDPDAGRSLPRGADPDAPQGDGVDIDAGPAVDRRVREPDAEPLDRTVALTGRVVDEAGRPIEDAEVYLTLRQIRRSSSARRIVEPVHTDARGRFRFRGPAYRSLSIVLEAFHPAFAPTVELRAMDGSQSELQLADLVLRAGRTVRGRVADEFGVGLAGAVVTLEPNRNNPMLWGRKTEWLRPQATTDASGSYAFANVAAGAYRARAELAGFEQGASPPFEVDGPGEHRVEDVVLRRGTVLSGLVLDVRDRPIEGARVQLRSLDGRGTFRAIADGEGAFAFEHLPTGTFLLGASARGFLDHEGEFDATAQDRLTIVLEDGLRVTGVVHGPDGSPVEEFAARPRRVRSLDEAATPPSGPRAPVPGRPRTGTPGAGLEPPTAGGAVGRSPFPADAGPPSRHEGGAFEFSGMLEGVYVVDVTGSAYQSVRTEEFELRRGQPAPHVVVHLPRGVRIHGAVARPDGSPAGGAQVELRMPAAASEGPPSGRVVWAAERATCDGEGRFAFENARAGRYELTASLEGLADATSPPFDAQGDTRVDLALLAFGAIEGRVQAVADLADTRVLAVSTEPGIGLQRSSRLSTPVEADGSYRLEDVAPGTYRVAVALGASRSWLAQTDDDPAGLVTVVAGQTTIHNPVYRAPAAGTIVGTVRGDGVPQDLRITATSEAPAPRGSVLGGAVGRIRAGRIEADGGFRIERVPEGQHTLRIATGRNRMVLHEEEVYVTRDREVRIDVTLDLVDLEGRVETADGSAASGHAVFFRGVDAPPDGDGPRPQQYRAAVTQGRFTADDMPRDRYCVVFTTGGESSHVAVSAAALDRPIVIPFPAR